MGAGDIILSGQLVLAIPVALLAGLVSFLSPCILPLVPGYLGYVGGFSATATDGGERRKNVWRMLAGILLFIAGFTVVFVAYGAAFGAMGGWLLQWQDLLIRILGLVVIVLGLVFMGLFGLMQRTVKLNLKPKVGLVGAPLLGIVFGLGWTPCIGPTLAAILSLSFVSASPWQGALLAVMYCLGLGVPFVLIGLGAGWATNSLSFFKRHIRAVNITGGVLLVVIGVLMVSGLWTAWIYQVQAVIIGYVPAI